MRKHRFKPNPAISLLAGALASLVACGEAPVQELSQAGTRQQAGACIGCPAPVSCVGCWLPAQKSRWQYQLQGVSTYPSTGGINTTVSAVPYTGGPAVSPDVFDIDLYADQSITGDTVTLNTAAVSAIHMRGHRAICYVNAGAWEDWRPDAQDFVNFDQGCAGCLLGQGNGWNGESWVNLNDDQGQRTFLLGKMSARVSRCKQVGFDGVEFDNVDGYSNQTGFQISAGTQLIYNASLANLAHQAGLSAALKNDVEQAAALVPYFDYTINEQCAQYSECSLLQPFGSAGKAVFSVEYQLSAGSFCPAANAANRNSIRKTVDLYDRPWTPCR